MSRNTHAVLRVMVALLLVVPLLALSAVGCGPADIDESVPEDTPAPAPEVTPEDGAADPDADPARVLVEGKCASGCHSGDVVWDAQYDEAGWRASIERMEGLGLSLSDEERETIVEYLAFASQ